MELERCQTRRIRERREAAEKARTEVRTQFARREQNLRDTVRLLEDRCHRRQVLLIFYS